MHETIVGPRMQEVDMTTLHETRLLTEPDQLNRLRTFLGEITNESREGIFANRITSVKEGGIYFAVSETYQPLYGDEFMWMDQTSKAVAESGYQYHWHPSILERVDVEIEEAEFVRSHLKPGEMSVLISPKVPNYDAPEEVAKDEHLFDDDMIRVHRLDVDEFGQVRGKFMESILVRDIPLTAWVAMLKDPNNIFGKSIFAWSVFILLN